MLERILGQWTRQVAKHTPTPWKATEIDGGIQVQKDHLKDVTGIFRGDEGKANGRFIVRAVNAHAELLEALKALVDCVADGKGKEQDALVVARAAIAKAKEQP